MGVNCCGSKRENKEDEDKGDIEDHLSLLWQHQQEERLDDFNFTGDDTQEITDA